jgi:hypothetical protein
MMQVNEPILKIVKRSLSFTFKNILPFIKFWALPFFVSTAFYALSSYYISSDHWFISGVVALIGIMVSLIAASFWVPKWIKFYDAPKKGIKVFSFEESNKEYLKRSTVFLVGVGVLFFLAVFISTLISSQSATFGAAFSAISVTAVFYIAYKFSFVLPAAALGEKITFMDSWQKSRGHSLRFLGVVLALTFLINLPIILMGLFSLLMYQMKTGLGIFGPFVFLGTVIILVTNIIFFGAFTIAWTDFYKLIRKK